MAELFPGSYKKLPIEIYKRLSIITQTLLVDAHHVHMHAAVITGKYQNHLSLGRQSRCFKDSGVKLEPNTLAYWMIRASELYFSILYNELH